MSYAFRLGAALICASSFTAACTASPPGDDAAVASASAVTAGATIAFGPTGAPAVGGALTAGGAVTVTYDPARLTGCRGASNGHEAWTITAFYKVNGGPIASFEVAGYVPPQGMGSPVIALPSAGTIELWFQNTSLFGCSAWDSSFGHNYVFGVSPAVNAPGFVGNAVSVVSRATCNAGPCDGDRHALESGFSYDTWARQRAAIKAVYFDVWKEGVTDFDNPALWQALDVQVHFRVVGESAFTTRYVTFDHRVGHDARYRVELAGLDPLGGGVNGSPIASVADCPTFATTQSGPPGSETLSADVELYVTVNGTELRPSGGGLYRGTFQNYEALYAVCRK
jgi:hypothetical protein